MIPCLNNKMKGENKNVFTFISNGDNYETVKTGNCGRRTDSFTVTFAYL